VATIVVLTGAFAVALKCRGAGFRFSLKMLFFSIGTGCVLLAWKPWYRSWPLHIIMLPIYLSLLWIAWVIASQLFSWLKRAVALVERLVAHPVSFGTGRDGRTRCANDVWPNSAARSGPNVAVHSCGLDAWTPVCIAPRDLRCFYGRRRKVPV
jgi:hypothetical protein